MSLFNWSSNTKLHLDSVNHQYDLSAFSSDTAGELDVLGHDGNPFGVDSAQICVFEETNESQHGMALETQIRLEILCDLTNKPLERQLSDQQLSTLLVLANLSGKRIESNQIK
ncbi:hypothetical protein IEQ34_014033 [Dendrobium chrysotoxum]|uniref:Uncharacterized protein n=1 Tax=Dendrobium chrysotoxum TaxID=161865 RepID=A0AAV7GJ28_DENCH|nr:hypothetical protein IEQ34_014033 [Dendrobium chrysotoxum]